MNKFIKSMVFTVAASSALLANSALAAQKLGIVDIQAVMQQLPQTAKMVESLKEEFKDDGAEIAQMEKDIKYYQEKQKRDSALMTEKEQEELKTKVVELYKAYQEKGQALQKKSQARQNEETGKLLALVKQAIDNIAAKDKFDLILRAETITFAKPELDISGKVVEQVSKLK
ncbi:MAG: OmpH family outer membrane protein [Thalassotalea sp.]